MKMKKKKKRKKHKIEEAVPNRAYCLKSASLGEKVQISTSSLTYISLIICGTFCTWMGA